MKEMFILPTTRKEGMQTDKFPKVRVKQDTYRILCEMSARSGLSIIKVTEKAVNYALENLVYDENWTD